MGEEAVSLNLATGSAPLFSGSQLARDWPFGAIEPFAYSMIMADPPWHFATYSDKGEGKSPQAQYDTMSMAEIRKLPVGLLATPDAVLWLWCTWPLLPEAIGVVGAWGFRYVTGGVWHKKTAGGKTAFGTGYRLRSACEPFLIGTVGNPATTKDCRNLVEGLAREHSRKPDEAFALAEKWMPAARRIEVFSRESRPGWDGWGNEAFKFNEDGEAI